jgi:molecular chaperone GrpE
MDDDQGSTMTAPGARQERDDRTDTGVRVVDRRWWARAATDGPDAGGDAASDKPAYVQELEARLAAKDEELRTTIARYRDASAEFEQARLRGRREIAKDVERGRRSMLSDLLDILDNLDRALEAAGGPASGDALQSGVEMVRRQFLATLERYGVRTLDAMGQAFDPALHEAAAVVPTMDQAQDGRIVGVIRQGYFVGEDVLRPSVVAVAAFGTEGTPA